MGPASIQYAASTEESLAEGATAPFACSRASAVPSSRSATSSSHHSKPSCTVISSGSSATRSCRRTPAPGGSTSPTTPGSSVASAFSSTAARSREGSPNECRTCRPSHTSPLSRTIAGAAIGSSEPRVTVRSPTRSGAVADGTNSRSATRSRSAASPSNGRTTKAPPADPWHAL